MRSGQKGLLLGRQKLLYLFALAFQPRYLGLAFLNSRHEKVIFPGVLFELGQTNYADNHAHNEQQPGGKIRKRPVPERMGGEIKLCYHFEKLPSKNGQTCEKDRIRV